MPCQLHFSHLKKIPCRPGVHRSNYSNAEDDICFAVYERYPQSIYEDIPVQRLEKTSYLVLRACNVKLVYYEVIIVLTTVPYVNESFEEIKLPASLQASTALNLKN